MFNILTLPNDRSLNDNYAENNGGVRAPDSVKRQRLYDDSMGMDLYQRSRMLMQQQQRRVAGNGNFGAAGVKTVYHDSISDFSGGRSKKGIGARSDKSWQNMFAPPTDILFRGTLDAARALGKKTSKWVLVNIQKTTEFASHQLNRDVWSDETLKELIKSHFVFIQQIDAASQRFCTLYHVVDFPCVLIIDSRTGAKLADLGGYCKASVMTQKVMDFVGAKSSSRSQNNNNSAAAAAATSSSNAIDLSEEELLRRAIAASLEEASTSTAQQGDGGGKGDNGTDSDAIIEAQKPPADETSIEIPANIPDEPDKGSADVITLRIRLPSGKSMQRRFRGCDNVKSVVAFVRSNPDAATCTGLRSVAIMGSGSAELPLEAALSDAALGLGKRAQVLAILPTN